MREVWRVIGGELTLEVEQQRQQVVARKSAEKTSTRLLASKNQLLKNVLLEFQQPIFALEEASMNVFHQVPMNQQDANAAKALLNNSHSLKNLIRDIATLEQLPAQILDKTELSLGLLVSEEIAVLSRQLPDAKVVLRSTQAISEALLEGDKALLLKMLRILIYYCAYHAGSHQVELLAESHGKGN